MRLRALFFALLLASLPGLRAQSADSIDVPEGARLLLQAKGEGVQIYACTKAPQGWKWTLKAPDARLLDPSGKAIGMHFAGPTWKLNDGGEVQGELLARRPAPDAGSVAWLLLRARPGTAKGSFSQVAFIRRTDTQGGAAPGSGCQSAANSGKSSKVPYSATYSFYAAK